jgi:membrane protein
MTIGGYRVGPLAKKTFKEVGADQVPTLAASAAYNFFFSLFPLMLFLAPILSLFGDKQHMIGFLSAQLTQALPPDQVKPITDVLHKVVFATNAPGLMSVGLVLAAWSGSNIFGTLMTALNTAYDVTERRGFLKKQLLRLGTLLVAGVIIVASTAIFLNGEGIAKWIGGLLHLGSVFVTVWTIVQFPLAACGLILLAFMIFLLLPNVKQRKAQVLVAAVITAVLWVIATLLFRLYIQHFPPNPAYGLIGGIIILLTWMYYTMFVVLLGGELASEMHHGTGAVAPRKGAVYYGRVVTGQSPDHPSAA